MAKPTGPLCNLQCDYCFYLEKEHLYPDEHRWRMSDEVLESYIRQVIEAQPASVVSFAWQGGEPTLAGREFFEKAVGFQNKYAAGRTVENAFQTNGVLLDDAWCAFFAKNQFLVGISVDGPRELHDRFRVHRGGHGSFEEVMNGIELLKKHTVAFNTLTAVHRYNVPHTREVYSFLKTIGSRYLQFIPIVERTPAFPNPGSKPTVAEWSVDPMGYGEFLCSVFDAWIRGDVGRVFVQAFDVALESWLGLQPGLCVFRETCGDAIILEHNGDAFACDHYVYPEFKLGNIIHQRLSLMAASEKQRTFGLAKRDTLPRYCRECSMRFACNGECPKRRFLATPEGEPGLNYLCAAYKKFFHHIDPAMRFMANELKSHRPPANVMTWMHDHDARLRRNDSCFCGSGNKYKYCHGI